MKTLIPLCFLLLLSCEGQPHHGKMKVKEATRDFNGDGRMDRISIWLTEGKRYDDSMQWAGMGEKYEGHFILVVTIAGKRPVVMNLNRLFYPGRRKEPSMFFWDRPWEFHFADYNNDGLLDFNLGQCAGTVALEFRLFTVARDGVVHVLPVEGRPNWFLSINLHEHSTPTIQDTEKGFSKVVYVRRRGEYVRGEFEWDESHQAFQLVSWRQAALENEDVIQEALDN